ncbi:MAG: hypothetical protein IH983_00215 [Planctomycetes bacterium]|nr:hypothetical protein [Planctomycetota bacterium]
MPMLIRHTPILAIGLALCGCTASASYRTFSVETLNQIERNPARYTNKLYAFQGRVIQAAEEGGKLVFQMITYDDSTQFGGPSLIVVYPDTKIPVVKDHKVRVLGKIGPAVSGTNLFGGVVSSVTMNAIAVRDVTARQVSWLTDYEDTFHQWKSGALFKPSD